MAREVILTADGRKKIEEELEELKSVKRPEIAEKIKIARSFGDLSENSEYDEAKNEQAKVEARIADLEAMLKNAKMVEESGDASKIGIGTKVKIYDETYEEEDVYQVVGSAEADPLEGRISDESPIGMALLGHVAGETVVAEAPQGDIKIRILEILQ